MRKIVAKMGDSTGYSRPRRRNMVLVLTDGGMAREMRVFGRTGMRLSVLGFGCGAVGGLMVRGDALDQERTVARAIAAGVNYFCLLYTSPSPRD